MDHIKFRLEGPVAWITIERPPLNILDLDTLEQLVAVLRGLSESPAATRAAVLTHAGELFSAGVDVRDHLGDRAERMLELFLEACRLLLGLPMPAVAAVNGPAIGGAFELALCCDLIVASERAKFSLPEIKVGTFPPVAAALLAEKLPGNVAAALIFAGTELTATRAHELGLVNHLAAPEDFPDALTDFVRTVAAHSGAVLRLAKKATGPAKTALLEAMQHAEQLYRNELMRTDDMTEGLNAFLQKRPPAWQDK